MTKAVNDLQAVIITLFLPFTKINLNKRNYILKVLIIDDEPDICFLLKNILQKRELEANYVNRLEEAKNALKKEEVSLIFLDNHLPDGLGIDFLNYLKTQYPAIKVIMITAHDSPEDRSKAMQRGVDLFLSKPFTGESINTAVDKLRYT